MTSYDNRDFTEILAEDGNKKGLSPRFLEFSKQLFNIQNKTEESLGQVNPPLSKETIDRRIGEGLPLLGYRDLDLDWIKVNSVFKEVTTHFAAYSDLFGKLPERLRKPKSRITLPKRMVKAWYEKTEFPETMAIKDFGEYMLMEVMIQATLRPFLIRYARALTGFIDQQRWRRNYCPICGGLPDFAFLDSEQGSRYLLCSRCDTEWLFLRLQCPYCNNQEQDGLAYFSDDKGIYRLYVCEQCHKYIKAIDLREAPTKVILPLERIFTLDMDRQAQDKGYQPG